MVTPQYHYLLGDTKFLTDESLLIGEIQRERYRQFRLHPDTWEMLKKCATQKDLVDKMKKLIWLKDEKV